MGNHLNQAKSGLPQIPWDFLSQLFSMYIPAGSSETLIVQLLAERCEFQSLAHLVYYLLSNDDGSPPFLLVSALISIGQLTLDELIFLMEEFYIKMQNTKRIKKSKECKELLTNKEIKKVCRCISTEEEMRNAQKLITGKLKEFLNDHADELEFIMVLVYFCYLYLKGVKQGQVGAGQKIDLSQVPESLLEPKQQDDDGDDLNGALEYLKDANVLLKAIYDAMNEEDQVLLLLIVDIMFKDPEVFDMFKKVNDNRLSKAFSFVTLAFVLINEQVVADMKLVGPIIREILSKQKELHKDDPSFLSEMQIKQSRMELYEKFMEYGFKTCLIDQFKSKIFEYGNSSQMDALNILVYLKEFTSLSYSKEEQRQIDENDVRNKLKQSGNLLIDLFNLVESIEEQVILEMIELLKVIKMDEFLELVKELFDSSPRLVEELIVLAKLCFVILLLLFEESTECFGRINAILKKIADDLNPKFYQLEPLYQEIVDQDLEEENISVREFITVQVRTFKEKHQQQTPRTRFALTFFVMVNIAIAKL